MDNPPLILLAAGGTGGHLFPAEALAVELIRRGLRVRLATDGRALRYGIGVGRPGFTWAGVKTISAKKEWPALPFHADEVDKARVGEVLRLQR